MTRSWCWKPWAWAVHPHVFKIWNSDNIGFLIVVAAMFRTCILLLLRSNTYNIYHRCRFLVSRWCIHIDTLLKFIHTLGRPPFPVLIRIVEGKNVSPTKPLMNVVALVVTIPGRGDTLCIYCIYIYNLYINLYIHIHYISIHLRKHSEMHIHAIGIYTDTLFMRKHICLITVFENFSDLYYLNPRHDSSLLL